MLTLTRLGNKLLLIGFLVGARFRTPPVGPRYAEPGEDPFCFVSCFAWSLSGVLFNKADAYLKGEQNENEGLSVNVTPFRCDSF